MNEEQQAIKIPGGPNFSDNYVLGMALDFTCLQKVHHPNIEKPDLLGAPVLVIATSDGVLRFYSFGNTDKSTEGLLAPAREPCKPDLPFARSSGENTEHWSQHPRTRLFANNNACVTA